MEGQPELGHSQLFTLRVSRKVLGDRQVYSFRNWQALIHRLSGLRPTEMPSERLPDSGRGEGAMQAEK